MTNKIIYPCILALLLIASALNPVIYQFRAALALIAGMILAFLFHNPYEAWTRKSLSTILSCSVAGLGFGVNLVTVAKAGIAGIGYTIVSILFCMLAGWGLGRLLKNDRDLSLLLTGGTAICGGSAIAALAPVIKARGSDISIALAVVFLFNAVALVIFPFIGHFLQLSQEQFGLWSALAIHDTSSVVGATLQYGQKSVEIGTTVKLARALWIVPLTLLVAFIYQHFIFKKADMADKTTLKKPWFILGFLIAAALVTWFPWMKTPALYLRALAEQGLVVALFCIGTNLSKKSLAHSGLKPFLQGLILWVLMTGLTLWFVLR